MCFCVLKSSILMVGYRRSVRSEFAFPRASSCPRDRTLMLAVSLPIASLFFVFLKGYSGLTPGVFVFFVSQGNTHMHPEGCVPLAARDEIFVVEKILLSDESFDAFFEHADIEVDEQAEAQVGQLQVG